MTVSTPPELLPGRLSRRSQLLSMGALATGATVALVAGRAGAATATTASDTSAPTSSGGFESGDAAVTAYLEALAAADFDATVATIAIEPFVENADFAGMIEYLGAYMASMPLLVPGSNPFNLALNRAVRRSEASAMVVHQYFALVNPNFDLAQSVALIGENEPATFTAELEATMTPGALGDLATFEVVDLADVDADVAELYRSDGARRTERTAWTGADERNAVAVTATVAAQAVQIIFEVVRYGDGWWVDRPGGEFAQLLGLPQIAGGVIWVDGAVATDSESTEAVPTTS